MSAKTKRLANFELLRIIAMAMVIALHYISRGIVAPKLSVDGSVYNHIWWLVLAFCNVSVNVYVLISGYFLVDAEWHVNKVIRLIAQVLFYSILVGIIVSKVMSIPLSFDNILTIILPIEYEHYWFATAYVIMYMLAPVLSIAVNQLPKKQLTTVIVLLLFIFSIPKSLNPYLIPTDSYGYDFGWFICLFLIAGYIKKYGIKLFDTKVKSIALYISGVVLNFLVCAATAYIVRTRGKLEYYMDMTYAYNYILVLFSSVAFFYIFTHINIKEGKFANIVCKIAPYTFGVYLLHENVVLRDNWTVMLGADVLPNRLYQPLHLILCVLLVFVVGCIVDMIRKCVFDLIENIFKHE